MISNLVIAQVSLKSESLLKDMATIPQERVYVHSNTSLFLTGEYLYYTIYCLNSKTNRLSDLSKVAYVEMVSKGGTQIFKQKIKLENGQGYGDFFIPVSTPTGSYKLLAYTNWMKNKGLDIFFKDDVHIINPYQVNKKTFLTNEAKTIDSLNSASNSVQNQANSDHNEGPVNMVLKNRVFSKRSKVSFTLEGKNKNDIPFGNYSISIRKKGKLPEPAKQNSVSVLSKFDATYKNGINLNSTSIYLPELRGELLSGKVITPNNSIVKNLKIAVSIPGDSYFINIVKTDENGVFYINIDKDYSGNHIFLEILDKPNQDYKIVLNEQASLDFSELEFKNLELDPLMKDEIVQRSIHNQIDNAFFKYKPDSVVALVTEQLFESKKFQHYKLDDFTRFRTIRETIFEIFKDVSISRIGKDKFTLLVQGYNYGTNSGVLPLVLIDGFQITNHNVLLDYNAFVIDEIKVYRDRLVLGPKVYQGALLFKTKNNSIDEFQNEASLFTANLLRPQLSKKYFTQRYDLNTSSRIPDDRLQLLWMPSLKVSEKVTALDFFTSDVSGEFEICIEGVSSKQEPVSIKAYFLVK